MFKSIAAAAILTALVFGAMPAQAERIFNGVKLNGLALNGAGQNGITYQGVSFNGVGVNGPAVDAGQPVIVGVELPAPAR